MIFIILEVILSIKVEFDRQSQGGKNSEKGLFEKIWKKMFKGQKSEKKKKKKVEVSKGGEDGGKKEKTEIQI